MSNMTRLSLYRAASRCPATKVAQELIAALANAEALIDSVRESMPGSDLENLLGDEANEVLETLRGIGWAISAGRAEIALVIPMTTDELDSFLDG